LPSLAIKLKQLGLDNRVFLAPLKSKANQSPMLLEENLLRPVTLRIFLKVKCRQPTGQTGLSGNMEAITVAIIAAVGGVIAALIQKGRAENKADHNVVASMLVTVKDDIINLHHKIDHVDEQVDKVDDKLDGHIDWHMKKIEKEKQKKTKGE
jgi:hypothetical protein